jgi:pyruvate/2-oxoglutarate dehydrogenase complex dihydrolipoamide dehydrogenase (E3) component
MTGAIQLDAVIIGVGQGGKPLAVAMAKAGWQTAIIEREHVGGTCVNTGCTPTKTMVASGRVAYLARRAADYGVNTTPVTVDIKRVIARKQAIVESFRGSGEKLLTTTANLELIKGEATITGKVDNGFSVAVKMDDGASRTLLTKRLFINTGARPNYPAIAGLEDIPFLDSTSIMELDSLPKHLIVLGGGYIGLEFGQMFQRFGSQVTVVHRGEQLLPREDDDVGAEVKKILAEDGLEILLETSAVKVEQQQQQILLTVKHNDRDRVINGSHLLVATGRVPNTEKLNLSSVGVELDSKGFIAVNDRLETNVSNIYALGDVKGGPAFTHISYDDYRIIAANLLNGANNSITGRMVPATVFIDPQLGRIGLSEREARQRGGKIYIAKIPMTWVARALEMDESRGFIKAIVDAETNQILGAAVLGVEGGEIMTQLQIAMMGKLPYTALRDGIFAHPTLAEALNTLFMYMPLD